MGAQASSYSRYAQNSTPPVGREGSAGSRRGSFTNSPITGSPVQGKDDNVDLLEPQELTTKNVFLGKKHTEVLVYLYLLYICLNVVI